ncbi:Uncharacterised protein [Arcanobacterium haemolyticum]|nr:Uncharacterised protein [Arcanobacterium haemolyticum]
MCGGWLSSWVGVGWVMVGVFVGVVGFGVGVRCVMVLWFDGVVVGWVEYLFVARGWNGSCGMVFFVMLAFLMVVCFCGGWLLGVGVLFDISIVCQLFYDIFLVLGWLVLLLVGLMLFFG